LEEVLAVKYRSGSRSLLKSPTAIPPPLYKNSRSIGLIESFSTTWLLKSIPDFEEGICLNKTGEVWQAENTTAIRIKPVADKKTEDNTFLILSIILIIYALKKINWSSVKFLENWYLRFS